MTAHADAAAPSPRRRVWLWVLGVVVALTAVFGLLFLVVISLTQPVVDRGDAFMSALEGGNFAQAYSLSTPELRSELGSAQKLGATIGAFRPVEWSWSQRSIKNGVGQVQGAATYRGGKRGSARIVFHKVGDEWRVAAFQLN